MRQEIAASWLRSQLLGVKRELPVEAIPGEPLFDADERLRRAVEPVLDELAAKLAGTIPPSCSPTTERSSLTAGRRRGPY